MKTDKVKRNEKRKTLTKQLKEQQRNISKVNKRIKRLEKQLWKIELKELEASGLLQQLTWEFVPYVRLFGTSAPGIRSKETTENNKIAQKIEKWIWKYYPKEEKYRDFVEIYKIEFTSGYKILLAIQLECEDLDGYSDYHKIVIFAADIEETGTGTDSEIMTLEQFSRLWKLKMDVNLNHISGKK